MHLVALFLVLISMPLSSGAHPPEEQEFEDGLRVLVHVDEEGMECLTETGRVRPCPPTKPQAWESLPEGLAYGWRPFDREPKEMYALVTAYFGRDMIGGCVPGPEQRCANGALPMAIGGPELARYLIRHHEEAMREGYPVNYTLLTMIGRTESAEGRRFLRSILERPVSSNDDEVRQFDESHGAIRALIHCRHAEALEMALSLLETEHFRGSHRNQVALIHALYTLMLDLGETRADGYAALDRLANDKGHVGIPSVAAKFVMKLRSRTPKEIASARLDWEEKVSESRLAWDEKMRNDRLSTNTRSSR